MVEAKFLKGPLMRHVMVMTLSASVGLIALFFVDLVDIYFLSLLEITPLTAAVGFAGNIMMLTISVNIGMMITMGALVAQSIGARKIPRAKQAAVNVYVFAFLFSVLLMTGLLVWIDDILTLIGAAGEAKAYAKQYLYILLPSVPFFTVMMCANGALRGVGDAARAMYVTLAGAAVNAVFDPILIFGFDLGIRGAAIASVLGRITMLAEKQRTLVAGSEAHLELPCTGCLTNHLPLFRSFSLGLFGLICERMNGCSTGLTSKLKADRRISWLIDDSRQ